MDKQLSNLLSRTKYHCILMNELWMITLAGLSIGIMGGFHCVGMCGPIALSLPIHKLSSLAKSSAVLLYNLGRALSYASMGLLFGIIGQSFVLFKMQQYLSIGAGLCILLVLLFSFLGQQQTSIFHKYALFVKNKLSQLLKSDKSISSYLSLGIVNGFLPCGLVYMAIAAAVATGSIAKSGLLMFAFGLGTLPIMALTMVFGKYISAPVRNGLSKVTPYFIATVAALLILRGLNLGIPYLSPTHDAQHHTCCHSS